MSIRLMTLAWNTGLPTTQKMVLLALADASNDEGACYPRVRTLCRKCSLSERAIQTAIKTLAADGMLVREERTGRSTIYHLTPENWTPAADAPPQEMRGSPPHQMHPPPHDVHPTPARRAPITVKEPSPTPKDKHTGTGLDLSVLPPITVAVWQDFLKHRKAIKAPLTTQTAVNRLGAELHRIAAAGIDPDEALSEAIESGWRTVKLDWILNRKQKDSPHETSPKPDFPNSAIERVRAANRRRETSRNSADLRIVNGERVG